MLHSSFLILTSADDRANRLTAGGCRTYTHTSSNSTPEAMVKNAVLFVALAVTAISASGLQVAGSDPGLCRPIPDPEFPIQNRAHGDGRPATGNLEDTAVIAYDDGTHQTWWCSDKDSFGAAVRFTPAGYPCYVVGARAEVGWDTTTGSSQIYLRMFDDDGAGGLPGTMLYEEHRTDVPPGNKPGFHDYDLTAPVTIDSGDFYLCFWQKHYFNMYFGSDAHFDSIPRQWWFLPPNGWVTPSGMDAADHLIRARVLYSTGVEEELAGGQGSGVNRPLASIVRGVLFLEEAASLKPQAASLLDASGRKVMDLVAGANDVRALAPGVYFVRQMGSRGPGVKDSSVRKIVIAR
jgi:hypothetical protein